MDCSALWTRRPDDFRRTFSLVPEFLQSPDDAVNLSELSIPLGRRFRALKLWAVLRCFGRSGLEERIREHVRLAALFEGWLRDEPGWEVVAPRHFSLVCFRREGADEDNERLLERVNASGEVFLSHARLGGRYALRLAIGNFRTTEDDVRLPGTCSTGRLPASDVDPRGPEDATALVPRRYARPRRDRRRRARASQSRLPHREPRALRSTSESIELVVLSREARIEKHGSRTQRTPMSRRR